MGLERIPVQIRDRMKQILQDLRHGDTLLCEVPSPCDVRGALRIESECSLVSLGTERMLIDFGRGSWLSKARQQPEKVRQVLEKIRNDGLAATYEAVAAKLDRQIPLGYSNVGRVLSIGEGVTGFEVGDRVVSNGPHAEHVVVAKNLCAKVPTGVSEEAASFTVIGAIGMQGIRLLAPTLGETVVVTGLGLIGLLAVQLLRSAGCRVIGIDLDAEKCALARQFGAIAVNPAAGEDPLEISRQVTGGRGVDGVLITAATKSNEPVHQAALMCRKRGRIVLVGVVGLQLSRSDFYEKELSFQVSCSYGPGRYDSNYEEGGMDYPFGYVRWTEQRNFEAFLDLLAEGRIETEPLVSHRFPFADALKAYDGTHLRGALGMVLEYPRRATDSGTAQSDPHTVQLRSAETMASGAVRVGVIGAGAFTGKVILPALAKTAAQRKMIVSQKGVSGVQLAQKHGFEGSSTDVDRVLDDTATNAVLVTTRHESHGDLVLRALKTGKHVYVEKPLCIRPEELEAIVANYEALDPRPILMVGFNRRFAPHVVKMKSLLRGRSEAMSLVMTVNAGSIPPDHWVQDPKQGGGRVVGEACHFIDLLRFLVGSGIREVNAMVCGKKESGNCGDTVTIQLGFEDGSTGTIHYFANGHQQLAKERLEVFSSGRVLQLDNFRRLTGYGWPGFSKMNLWKQDKGHQQEIAAFVEAVETGKPAPIPFGEIVEVTRATFLAAGLEGTTETLGTE